MANTKKESRLALLLAHRAGGRIRFFTLLTAEYKDVLYCAEMEEPFDPVWVGKPYMLRSLPAHGSTSYTYSSAPTVWTERTASLLSNTEEQKITPDYIIGDLILAARMPAQTLSLDFSTTEEVIWQEIESTRIWAFDPAA